MQVQIFGELVVEIELGKCKIVFSGGDIERIVKEEILMEIHRLEDDSAPGRWAQKYLDAFRVVAQYYCGDQWQAELDVLICP